MKDLLKYLFVAALMFCLGCGGGESDYYTEALEAARDGRNEEAIELFKRSLKEHPRNARAHNYLGTLCRRMGDSKAAQDEFEEAVAIDPSFGVAFYNLGTVYEERGMFEDARKNYMRAIDLAANLTQAHNSLGVVSTKLGLYAEAVKAFKSALDTDGKFANAHLNLGVVYANKIGEKEKAKEHLKMYVEMVPEGDKARRAQTLLIALGEQSPLEFYDNGVELVAGGHFEKALNQFEKALAVDPKFAPAMLEVAKVYDLHLENKEKAVQYYERYLELNLMADDAPHVMSLLASAREDLKPSLQEAEKKEQPPTPQVVEVITGGWEDHRDKALDLQGSGEHSSAIEEFKRAVELNPDLDMGKELARSYHELGVEHIENGRFDEAVESFQRALSLLPAQGETEYQLGKAYDSLREFEKALGNFERASAHGVTGIGRDVAAAHAAMGEEYFKAGREQEALKCYEKALERNPSNAELHLKMARLLREGKYYKRALGEYRKALDIDPNYANAHGEVASLLDDNLNDRERAILHYRRYLQLAPSAPDARSTKAAIESLTEEVGELKKYRKMVKNYPLRAEVHYNLAVVLQERSMLDEAIAEYKKTIKLKPDFDRAYFNLGAVYMKRGYYDRAIQMYRSAVQLNPGYVKAYNNLGVLYSKRGRYEDALASYEKTLSIDPTFASAHFNLALLYKNLGKKDKALYHYRKYVEYAPGGEYASEVREILKKQGRQSR